MNGSPITSTQAKVVWGQIWPAITTAAAVWAIFYQLVVIPLQETEKSFNARISRNDDRFVEIYAFKAAVQKWQTHREVDIEHLRSDLAASISVRE